MRFEFYEVNLNAGKAVHQTTMHPTWLVLFMLLGCLSKPAFGLEPIAVLSPSDGPTDAFGGSVAISGDFIAVGDPANTGFGGGAVYVFRRIGPNWVEQAKLTGDWPRMGWSVAMDGDVIVAGAPFFDIPCDILGVVFVFRRNSQGTLDDPADDTWVQEARLTAPKPESPFADGFGRSVAVRGDVLVAGDCWEKAHVFEFEQGVWTFHTTLTSPDPVSYQGFGYAVDIDGSRIVVGAPYSDDARGAAHVFSFSKNHWEPEDILTVSNSQAGDGFGSSLAIRGDRIVSGAIGVDDAGFQSNSGAAYVFQREPEGAWSQQQKVAPSLVHRSAQFGSAVAIDDNLTLVAKRGSPLAYVFENRNNQWVETIGMMGLYDSYAVSVSEDFAVVARQVYVVRNRKSVQDFAVFQNCFGLSTEIDIPAECQSFDLKGDGQLDFHDFGEFMATVGGP